MPQKPRAKTPTKKYPTLSKLFLPSGKRFQKEITENKYVKIKKWK